MGSTITWLKTQIRTKKKVSRETVATFVYFSCLQIQYDSHAPNTMPSPT